ncbi:MAG: hypothetical protein PWP63_437 [Methanolobus sp.]|jgi:Na+/H+ antiporter NhaD/arsenite permease-like protein|nr:hypothetical protein [Methanolobus sp.]
MGWHTLVFFAAMFILMVSVLLSQFISNVPPVALYLPVLSQADMTALQMMAQAAGSTIAGNLSILGAASNVIIIQNAEKKGGISLKFSEFALIGVPLTILQICVYWLFLSGLR